MQNTDAVISESERTTKELPEVQACLPWAASEHKMTTPLGITAEDFTFEEAIDKK